MPTRIDRLFEYLAAWRRAGGVEDRPARSFDPASVRTHNEFEAEGRWVPVDNTVDRYEHAGWDAYVPDIRGGGGVRARTDPRAHQIGNGRRSGPWVYAWPATVEKEKYQSGDDVPSPKRTEDSE